MKAMYILLIGALLATGYAYPASKDSKSNPADDAEFVVVPLEHQRPSYFNRYPSSFDAFDGVLDTDDFPHQGQSPIFFPSINPFTWQFSSYLDDLMRRFRDRFAGSWNPFYGGSDFAPSGPGLWPIDIPDDSSEGGKTNTTSTVKVIDGHKVIINDTYYTKKTDFGTSIFKVRVVDVKPLDEEGADKPSTDGPIETGNRVGTEEGNEPKKPAGTDADEEKNSATEGPKRDTELESSDEETTPADESLNTINNDIDSAKKEEVLESLPLSEVNSVPLESQERNMLRHNYIYKSREDAESTENTDDDVFSPDEWKQYHDERKRITVPVYNRPNRFPTTNQHQFDAAGTDSSNPTVIDLSNDIAINYLPANEAIPLHPDVEVFAPVRRRRPAQQDPMQPFPVPFPTFPQPYPGGNRYPVSFPNQFAPNQYPQGPGFPGGQIVPLFPTPTEGQFLVRRPANLMMGLPSRFPVGFREVRP
ncbi:uncharacterized protein LOC129726439 [Wyeomyia smithii]|uniref:uncharacterized protein LOC129726439 n=1 Tax=Wyeomyia smithii TaxID=174621 RepID=UPI002467FC3D|nr:uncharacterized protein LOC129726439 [Wyeomyia smithii]